MHVLVHGDVARPRGGRAVIERYRNARPARVVRPVLHGRAVQRNGRRLRPAAEREDIPAVPETVTVCVYRFETVLYDLIPLVRYKNPAFIYLDLFRKYRCELPA